MTWFLLALLASLAWAVVQLIDKTLISSEAPSTHHYWVVSGVAALVPVVLIPMFQWQHITLPGLSILLLAVVAGVCYFISNAFFFRAVLQIDASITSASLAAVPSLTAVGSWLILRETFGWLPVIGIAAITMGIVVMSNARPMTSLTARIPTKAWVVLGVAEIILVVEYLMEGAVVRQIGPLSAFFWSRVGVLLSIGVVALANRRLVLEALVWAFRRSRKVGLLTAGNECLDMTAIALLLAAYSAGPVGVATAVAYSQSAFVFLVTLGTNALRPGTIPTEGDRPEQFRGRVVGLLIVLLGIFLANL